MFFVLLTLAYASDLAAKEDNCFLLASYLVREKQEEIVSHLRLYPHLKEPEVRMKIIELGYYECFRKINEDQIRVLKTNNKKEYSKFRKLVEVDFSELTSLKDVKLSPEFMKKRQEIGKRVSFTKKSGPGRDL